MPSQFNLEGYFKLDSDKLRAIILSTGMVSLPPVKGGAIEAYVTDLSKIFNGFANIHTTVISNVRDSFAQQNSRLEVIKTHSPIDDFPLSLLEGTVAHSLGGLLTFFASRQKFLKRTDENLPEVYHLNEEVSLLFFSLTRRKFPIVYTIHNPPPCLGINNVNRVQKRIRKYNSEINLVALKNLHAHIISINPQLRKWLLHYGYEESRIHDIPLPINTDVYSPMENFDHASSDFALFVGRLDGRKNPIDLLKALKSTQKKRRLIMVGSGPMSEAVSRYIEKYNLKSQVSLFPRVTENELISLYQRARFLCFPSHLEAFPRVVAEAASCGTPVVHQRIPIFKQYQDAGFGASYKPESIKDLAETMDDLFEDNKKLQEMSVAARDFALRTISYDVVGHKTVEAYWSAINDRQ